MDENMTLAPEDEKVTAEVETDMGLFGNPAEFDHLKIDTDCDCCCETVKTVDFKKCEDYKEVCLNVDMLDCQTRLLKVTVEMCNVCKNRFLALSVLLTRIRNDMIITQKGKILFTGASAAACKKVKKDFCFTLPGDLCEDPCPIEVKVVANYIYTNPFGTLPCKDKICGGKT